MRRAWLRSAVSSAAILVSSGLVASELVSTGALAQQTPSSTARTPSTNNPATDTAASDAAGTTSGAQLSEIIVTAQRRAENLQRAAVPVDVLSAQAVLKAGVTDPTALSSLVPALNATPAGGSRVNFFLRGVGNFTANPVFESAIAFNYDGVYISRPGSTSGVFYDLDRIEVLKGPQGTLYGRNATGGAINVLPVKPKIGEFSGYATGSYGNYNAVDAEGAVNVPLGPKAALRVSGNYVKHDGYLSDGSSDDDTHSVRVQVLSELTPALTVRVSGDYAHVGGLGTGTTYVNSYQFNPGTGQYVVANSGLSPATGFYDPAAQAFRETLNAGPAGRNLSAIAPLQYSDNTFYGANAQIDYDTGAGTLTVIPAWRYGNTNNITDTSGFVAKVFNKDEQYSVEARFVGKPIGPIDYTAGAFYYHDSFTGGDAVDQQALENFEENIDQRTRSLAVFARLTGHVSDRLRLVAAGRFTNDRKVYSGDAEGLTIVCVAPTHACPNVSLFPLVDQPGQLPPPVPPPGGVAPLIGTGAIITRSPSITPNDEVTTTNRVTYRAALEYDIGPRSLAYASVETGFRAGGFNLAVGYDQYKPEYITAYTIGTKNRFFNNRVQLNLEGYYWKYRNQQLAHIGVDLAGHQSYFAQNLGNLTIYGLDAEGRFLLTPSTALSGQVQYLHTKYTSFEFQVPTGVAPPFTSCANAVDAAAPGFTNVNCSGMPGYNSPRWTVNLGGEQTFRLRDYKLVASVDTQYRSGRYVGFDFSEGEYANPTWQTSAQLTFGPDNDAWSIAGFIRNIENDRYLAYAAQFAVGSSTIAVTAPPRTYGVRASVKF